MDMAVLRILSAGAAQAVAEKIAAAWTRDTGNEVTGEFSAVGAMKARVVAGEAVDVIVLTGALIEKPWQGGPPEIKSSSPGFKPVNSRMSCSDNSRISSVITCVAGLFLAKVSA